MKKLPKRGRRTPVCNDCKQERPTKVYTYESNGNVWMTRLCAECRKKSKRDHCYG